MIWPCLTFVLSANLIMQFRFCSLVFMPSSILGYSAFCICFTALQEKNHENWFSKLRFESSKVIFESITEMHSRNPNSSRTNLDAIFGRFQ